MLLKCFYGAASTVKPGVTPSENLPVKAKLINGTSVGIVSNWNKFCSEKTYVVDNVLRFNKRSFKLIIISLLIDTNL